MGISSVLTLAGELRKLRLYISPERSIIGQSRANQLTFVGANYALPTKLAQTERMDSVVCRFARLMSCFGSTFGAREKPLD